MNKSSALNQPWIDSPSFDLLWILSPSWIAVILVTLLPPQYRHNAEVPVVAWVVLILLIDVAHVYSTLFRTYFNAVRFKADREFLIFTPIACYVGGVLVYSIDGTVFWRCIAYLAVFHFIRQQYGFMKLYSRGEQQPSVFKKIDVLTIYSVTIYPIVFWHFSGDRLFSWFLEGDFYIAPIPEIRDTAFLFYLFIILLYLVKETYSILTQKFINIPRNLVVISTGVSWYMGIVYFNADLIFTLLNVVAHGIPYMALVWTTSKKENNNLNKNERYRVFFSRYGVLAFLAVLFLFAWIEEGLWDGMVWRERRTVFPAFSRLPELKSSYLLAFVVPLLSLPQITHYILDGFIWKRKKSLHTK
ncbi:MAG TPA: hypothetical protein VL098_00075 [Flavipsychrobacter sp.]|nr:hypothetical protein [Flavipsychrobacter sp.]